MSREVRKVSKDWSHTKDESGEYIPLLEELPFLMGDEIEEGFRDGWLHGKAPEYDYNIMPLFEEGEATHLQMYQTTSEGTPISPVMESAEELAHWLADNKASSFAGYTTTYECWLSLIQKGLTP